jgi:hypothetical protein
MAEPRLEPSVIVEADKSDQANTTKMTASKIRTSSGMFFERGEKELVKGETSQRLTLQTQFSLAAAAAMCQASKHGLSCIACSCVLAVKQKS